MISTTSPKSQWKFTSCRKLHLLMSARKFHRHQQRCHQQRVFLTCSFHWGIHDDSPVDNDCWGIHDTCSSENDDSPVDTEDSRPDPVLHPAVASFPSRRAQLRCLWRNDHGLSGKKAMQPGKWSVHRTKFVSAGEHLPKHGRAQLMVLN